jgi:hypothetical protein
MISQSATSTAAASRQPGDANDVASRPKPVDQARSLGVSKRPAWPTVAVGGATAIAVSCAAAVVSREVDPAVGIAAWVTAAVIGTAAIISTSVVEGPRSHRRSASPSESEVSGRERHA